ncbi:MAG TPA: cyclic nucleotide-binding domain-containing protein [Ktedonobacteraceae bacterium]
MQQPVNQQPVLVGVQHRANLRPLNEDEVRFEIDMCIGCDRCMRACPVPLSSAVKIADLNRATISDEMPPHVARFTEECVMCGSCVPVCPVNNHRDLLMLSLKQRLGVSWDGAVDVGRILQYLPPGWDIKLLLSRLRELPMFSDSQLVSENYLLHMVTSSKLIPLLPGTLLMQEGEYSRAIYLILEGRFSLSTGDISGTDLPLAVIRRGEYLGEDGMLTGQPREATARAQTAAIVLEVPEQAIQRLMELIPALQRFFEQVNGARSLESVLKRMALFQDLSPAEIRLIAGQATVTYIDRDVPLFAEQDGPAQLRETVHILLEGFVKVARQTTPGTGRAKGSEKIIAYRQSGDYFAGGLDLLGDGKPVSVTTITRVRVAKIPQSTMLNLFTRYPALRQRFSSRLRQYHDAALAAQTGIFAPLAFTGTQVAETASDAEARSGLRSLVGGGVVEGTEVLVIDLDKCVHCNECEEACARRHGHSRMNRKGMVVGNISIATACRQCQDPVCMLCSRAGIARLPSGEVYITESCIGCGICAERCPYDNISITSLTEEADERHVAQASWQRFTNFFTQGAGKERGRSTLPMLSTNAAPGPLEAARPRDAYGEIRKKVAIKCDLCAGYDNQACVQACPTGAAIRVQPAAFFGDTENILRQRVQ